VLENWFNEKRQHNYKAQNLQRIIQTSDGQILTAKKQSLFKLVITSHFSRRVQIWSRLVWPIPQTEVIILRRHRNRIQ